MQTKMIIALTTLSIASGANAAFTGGVMRLNTLATTNANIDLGAGAVTVFDLILTFDEADDILISIGNANVTTGTDIFHLTNTDPFTGAMTIAHNTTADLPSTADPIFFSGIPAFPGIAGDSYVGIGRNFGSDSSTTTDPSFGWEANGFHGGWFSTPIGGVPTGSSVAGVSGFEVLAGRFALVGDHIGVRGISDAGNGFIAGAGGLFSGAMDVNWVEFDGAELTAEIGVVLFPAPGAAALFGIAGLAASRRRRG